jgi:hypothetical protein
VFSCRNQDSPPVVQLAFQYSILVPHNDDARPLTTSRNHHNNSAVSSRQGYTLKRRLRIRTLQIGVAANYAELYESVEPEVILTVLTHKIIQASLEDGVKEARALLHDWLVILTAQYNEYNKLAQFGQPDNSNRVDATFSKCQPLQALPRHVFALLRSSLLRSHEEGVHPDHRIYLQCLFRYKHAW